MMNINLIAERRARKMREMTIIRLSIVGVVGLCIVMVGLNVMGVVQLGAAKRSLEVNRTNLAALEKKQEKLQLIVDEINDLRPMVELLKQVRVSEGAWMTMLADIGRVVPNDVVLTAINTEANKDGVSLRLSGRARDERTVGHFMEMISQWTKWALTPKLNNVTADQGGNDTAGVRFDITVPVQGLYGGELQ